MKFILPLFFIVFTVNLHAQEEIFLDANGNEIKKRIYNKKLRNNDSLYSTWAYKGTDGKKYYKLKKDLYLKAVFKYQDIKRELEKLINKPIPANNTILIEYYYKDDLCTTRWDNNWTQNDVKDQKNFLNPLRENIETKPITYIVLFETSMTLKNKLKSNDEYFFIDSNNYFRNLFFKKPTLCGSFSLTKPNGQTLIRNGEYRADWMADHLNAENWSLFFKTK